MILLDTDVLIDFLYQRNPSADFVRRLHAEGRSLATTSVNVGELLRGAGDARVPMEVVLRALEALQEIPFGPRAARRFGPLMHTLDRAGVGLPLADGLIAAIALESGAVLATRNEKDFRRVPGLEVRTPD